MAFSRKKVPSEIKSVTTEISILFSYEWNEDVPNEERDTDEYPSRPFCRELIELDKLYTRVDIEEISRRLGYLVWYRKGVEGCRHRWVRQTVVKTREQ